MSDIVIKVENLGKRYRIGEHEAYKTFREALVKFSKTPFQKFKKPLSKEQKIKSNTQLSALSSKPVESSSPLSALSSPLSPPGDTLWALKDVSFEVKQGEVVGIIGRNGAGKSTLLKILSKITEPTEGRIELKGRVGSLLEVGTGFHPELTGHENIYLYGAILGMDRWEVTSKFDEIVAFAELEKFVDTPVKHYSSGMYMRLAFAVAAHLEPEILLVDEVLAVGDATFQKKCLGKMGDVSKEGRTVLFVSHNMAAIMNLCHSAILLKEGYLVDSGLTSQIVNHYLDEGVKLAGEILIPHDKGGISDSFFFRLLRVLKPGNGPTDQISLITGFDLEIEYEVLRPLKGANIAFHLWNNNGICIFSSTDVDQSLSISAVREPGRYVTRCHIPPQYLRPGRYYISISSSIPNVQILSELSSILAIDVVDTGSVESKIAQGRQGVIAPILNWTTQKIIH
jgi:lipopolysaccharide transport system ATP-binding protein